MYLCYMPFESQEEQRMELCLLSARMENINPPIKVDLLKPSESAFYWIGFGEGVVIQEIAAESARIIRPLPPAEILLTPSSPNQPGVNVASVKIIKRNDGTYEVYYSRDRTDKWQRWIANQQRKDF